MPERPGPSEDEVSSEFPTTQWEQAQPPWEDLNIIDDNSDRTEPDQESRERMDKSLEELGDIFKGATFNWELDGALNISLMKGEYIGNHKDVDISVEQSELEEVEQHLLKKGYGFFLSRRDDTTGEQIMRRIGHARFSDVVSEHLLIAAIDKEGKLRNDTPLNFIDAHKIVRDEDGAPLGAGDVHIPEKWVQPFPIKFHGRDLNLSHPAKILYYKLHQDRKYDATDIEELIATGMLVESDLDEIMDALETYFISSVERGSKIFENAAREITANMDAGVIYEVFKKDELIEERDDLDQGMHELANRVANSSDKSSKKILELALNLFGVIKKQDKKRAEVAALKQRVIERGNT